MLEALLSAREKLYVSWVGRNVRDNSEQPPSVLVAQLRDYLKAGWHLPNLDPWTTVHALQPFSRRYFEEGGLRSYAAEWRGAHSDADADAALPASLPPYELEPGAQIKLGELATFVRQPARYFFRRRLEVRFVDADALGQDEEPFGFDALERYALEDSLLDDAVLEQEQVGGVDAVRAALAERAGRLAREGMLPIGLRGRMWQDDLVAALVPVRSAWLAQMARLPQHAPRLAVGLEFALADGAAILVDDWIDRLRANDNETVWLLQISSKVLDKEGRPRADKLIGPWLRQLASAASGHPVAGCLVARDAVVEMAPLEPSEALAVLDDLIALWRRNLDAPLPVACATSLAWLGGGEADAKAVYEGGFQIAGEAQRDPCLARLWPDFAALAAQSDAFDCAQALYGPLLAWIEASLAITPIAAGGEGGQ